MEATVNDDRRLIPGPWEYVFNNVVMMDVLTVLYQNSIESLYQREESNRRVTELG